MNAIVCVHTMQCQKFLDGRVYFNPIIGLRKNSFVEGSIFVSLHRSHISANGGWNLIVMSPKGEVGIASEYHFKIIQDE